VILIFNQSTFYLQAETNLLEDTVAPECNNQSGFLQTDRNITENDVDRLVDRLNHNLMEAEKTREELRSQVAELTQQFPWPRNDLETTQTTDYFEDDFLESSAP